MWGQILWCIIGLIVGLIIGFLLAKHFMQKYYYVNSDKVKLKGELI